MANSIILKSKAVTEVGGYIAFSVGLALNDGSKDIPAKFSLNTVETTLPMIGISEYGKLVGLVSSDSEPFTVTATPLAGGAATEAYSTVADTIEAEVGASIASSHTPA